MGSVAPSQGTLFGYGQVEIRQAGNVERIDLGDGAWADMRRGWLGGADQLAHQLISDCDWRHHRRRMYDRMVDEPRLSRWYRYDEALPHMALADFRGEAGALYGVPFGAMGLNYYRGGGDSVAFHADRELKHLDDTLVAILTLGATRPFLLRPLGGGRSLDLCPGSGDLLVMGGTCQSSWEHAVPKVRRGVGPRVSASIRWAKGAGSEVEWTPSDRQEPAV